ncbi:hypothetical protein V8G54_017859 [Vigna mungo]|uniref:Uncharacterized protein n=1 Tax=Vigna mungo TaxID=3915 RepID=A0AAQ3RZ36_VIGMU
MWDGKFMEKFVSIDYHLVVPVHDMHESKQEIVTVLVGYLSRMIALRNNNADDDQNKEHAPHPKHCSNYGFTVIVAATITAIAVSMFTTTATVTATEGGECDEAGGEGVCGEVLGEGEDFSDGVGGDGDEDDCGGDGGGDEGGGDDGGGDDGGGDDGGGDNGGGGDGGGDEFDGGEDELSASSGVLSSGVESSGVALSGELLSGEEDIVTVSQNSHEALNYRFRPKICIQKSTLPETPPTNGWTPEKNKWEKCFVSQGRNVPDWKKTGVLNRKKKGNVLHAKKSIIRKELLPFLAGLPSVIPCSAIILLQDSAHSYHILP